MTKLSKHFTLAEMTVTSTGISNTPEPMHLKNLTFTASQMELVREVLGNKPIRVNSAYRSPAVNAAVGGVKTSHHAQGFAVDFTCSGYGTPLQVCHAIVASGIAFDQIIFEHVGKAVWVHISFAPRMRGQVLTYKGKQYTKGLPAK